MSDSYSQRYPIFARMPRKQFSGKIYDWRRIAKSVHSRDDLDMQGSILVTGRNQHGEVIIARSTIPVSRSTKSTVLKEYFDEYYALMKEPSMCFDPFCRLCNNDNTPKESSMSISNPAQSLAEEVRRIGKDHNADLSGITSAIERAESERQSSILSDLRSVMRLEQHKSPRGKQFRLATWQSGDYHVIHGIDYAYGEIIKENEEYDAYRVFLEKNKYLTQNRNTMRGLKKHFEDRKIPYVLEYVD